MKATLRIRGEAKGGRSMRGSPDDTEADFRSGLDLHLDLTGDRGVGRSLETALREAVRRGRLTAGYPAARHP
jgi:hypothetical protein